MRHGGRNGFSSICGDQDQWLTCQVRHPPHAMYPLTLYHVDPSPWIATLTIRGRTYGLPLEHRVVRLTRPLHERPWILLFLGAIYIIGLSFFVRTQSFLTPAESWIGCTNAFWGENDECGLDGNACAPFTNSSFQIRCPAQCSTVDLQNPRTIGDEQVNFTPLIVGGGDENFTYRGDSFLCAAAIQA